MIELIKDLSDSVGYTLSQKKLIAKLRYKILFEVNSSNVNDLVFAENYEYRTRESKTTLLHAACALLDEKSIKNLLELGADPNKGIYWEQREIKFPIAQATNLRIYGNSPLKLRIYSLLKEYGANLNYSFWIEFFCANFKSNHEEMGFLNENKPSDMMTISSISTNEKWKDFWKQTPNKYKNYPILEDIEKFEEKNLTFTNFGGGHDLDKFLGFFQSTSLKEALFKRYGIKSNRLTNYFSNKVITKNSDSINFDAKFIIHADKLKEIFLEKEKPNVSDFLDCLEKCKYILVDEFNFYYYKKNLKFLFSDGQIKELLLSLQWDDCESKLIIADTMNLLHYRYINHIRNELNQVSFNEINSFHKLHDKLVEIRSKIPSKEQNFTLHQSKRFPQLLQIQNISLPEGFGLKLAEDNFELIRWGLSMRHCVGLAGYGLKALSGLGIILAITKDGDPKYCVELSPEGQIVQIQGNSGSYPPDVVVLELNKGLAEIGIIKLRNTISP